MIVVSISAYTFLCVAIGIFAGTLCVLLWQAALAYKDKSE